MDNTQSSAGGVVGGKVFLQGGKKPLRLTTLTVKLLYVNVQVQDGSALPKIDTRVLLDQTIAAGENLPPGSQHEFSFRFVVPVGTLTTAHNVSYTVVASADIPGVKDPSAQADLRVVDVEDDDLRLLPLDDVFSRYPGLRSQHETQVCDDLNRLFLDCYAEGAQLMEVAPHLANLMKTGTVEVRRAAVQAWANLVDNRVKPEHLADLYAVANTPGLDQDTFDEVIKAGCMFAEEGALGLVQQLAQYGDSHVRAKVASGLHFNAAEKFNGKREVLIALVQDSDARVRSAAMGALSCYCDDHQIMHGVAHQLDKETSAEVQAAAIATLSLAHQYGMEELVVSMYEKHLSNPNPRVRKEIADHVHWLPRRSVGRISVIVQRLLQDQDEEVRSAMVFQFHNLSEMPQLLPLIQHAAQHDPSEAIRRDAMGSMAELMSADQVVSLYTELLARDPSEDSQWTVLNGLRSHMKHEAAKKMILRIAQSPNGRLAEAARDTLTEQG